MFLFTLDKKIHRLSDRTLILGRTANYFYIVINLSLKIGIFVQKSQPKLALHLFSSAKTNKKRFQREISNGKERKN
jgi:hypothetical protein